MSQHFWFGEWLDDTQLDEAIAALDTHLAATLAQAFPFDDLLAACDALVQALTPEHPIYQRLFTLACETTTEDDAHAMLQGSAASLMREAMQGKLRAELGCSRPGVLAKRYPHRQFETWFPIGCVVHVMPSNVFAVAALGLVESLLVGNVNVVKLSARDSAFAAVFAQALCELDASGRLQHYIAVVHVASAQQARLQALFKQADAISAWGGEKAIQAIKQVAPQGARVISWGHKVSFAYLAREALDDDTLYQQALDGFARDVCRLDQQACSSPQTLFVETDNVGLNQVARDLAQRLAQVSPTIAGALPDQGEQAEITSVVSVTKAEQALGLTQVIEDKHAGRWRILVDYRPGVRPSPLYRTIWLKPIQREQVTHTLRPMRAWLQSCGLACGLTSLAPLSRALLSAGVTRIARPGEMVDSYLGSPHDGVYALAQLSKRVTVDASEQAAQIGSFAELEPRQSSVALGKPILDKAHFQALSNAVSSADLVFRSGGSSGKTVYSTFSWDDYHDQMRAAAHGMVAAGLNPAEDRIMNLFAAGHLYGSFISFWTILETLRVKQLPMAMIDDYDEIAEVIVDYQVNALVGAPSHILGLFNAQKQRLKGVVKKVFYGGEKLTRAQARFLSEDCGVEVIRSAAYGSNDAGPMGYQCPHCVGGEHHVCSSIQQLEIVDMDEDKPVAAGDTGRLLFTSSARSYPPVVRYEIGDTGRWIDEPCACGRTDPKFELQGRMGDFFKAGGPFFNYRQFVNILDQQLDYTGPVQIHVYEDGHTTVLKLALLDDHGVSAAQAEQALLTHYPTIGYMMEIGLSFRFEAVVQPMSAFDVVAASGKIRPICDDRGAV